MRAFAYLLVLCFIGATMAGCNAERQAGDGSLTTVGQKIGGATEAAEKTAHAKYADELRGDSDPASIALGKTMEVKEPTGGAGWETPAKDPAKDASKMIGDVAGPKTMGVPPPAGFESGGKKPTTEIVKSIDKALSSEKTVSSPTTPPTGVADPVVGRDPSTAKMPKQQNALPSGILTAGSFDDNVDPVVFSSYVRRMSQLRTLGDLPTKFSGQRLLLFVKDGAGKPVGNARVKLAAGANTPVEILTRTDGRAVFMLNFDQLPANQALVATVTGPAGGSPVTETITAGVSRWEVTLPSAQGRLPKNLDLAIVIDTTGSMGDELKHLQAEIRGISAAIAKQFPEVKQRFALVCYRDEGQGDEYVTRPFDFTDSLDAFHKNLRAQGAGGGGDYPEAIHRGLEESLKLRWKDDADTARIVFLVADAPPHTQHMNNTMAAANALRKKGVALYPVACSGYDEASEFVMRSCALITGSRFLFLTDDSGVGSGHAEPTIPYYQVERAEKLMIRMIASELSGQHIQANPADIIRTVGKKVN
ncbi:MAG: VWA domain-containing protein [Gemmataceae bacterium]|nr:VWA domain-containing protein [Gemmataceae bacterium]